MFKPKRNWPYVQLNSALIKNLAVSLVLYIGFSILVFIIMGKQPLLGTDHISYFGQAESILQARPGGDYWREANSVKILGVLMAYLYAYTGSHVGSMKIILAISTVLYMLTFELFLSLFTSRKWKRVLFTILSTFAVSFGVSSWGMTDSTALLSRSLVVPFHILVLWFYWRFYGRPARPLAYTFLVLCSLVHLSSFYVLAILIVLEAWDFTLLRKRVIDAQILWFFLGLALSLATLLGIQNTDFSTKNTAFVYAMAKGGNAGVPSASRNWPHEEAWRLELGVRAWRNMPLPLVNIANIISSYLFIMVLASIGFIVRKRRGLNRNDWLMLGLFVSTLAVALGPQTLLWIIRPHFPVHPVNVEEIRALSFVMIPSIYFTFRLFERVIAMGGKRAIAGGLLVIAVFIALPLAMKSLPTSAREKALSLAVRCDIIDSRNPPTLRNARSALGIVQTIPLYYPTENLRKWFNEDVQPSTRVLTDRDDLTLLKLTLVGAFQPVVLALSSHATEEGRDALFETGQALASGKTEEVVRVAQKYHAELAVVPWPVADAVYIDQFFSVIRIPPAGSTSGDFR